MRKSQSNVRKAKKPREIKSRANISKGLKNAGSFKRCRDIVIVGGDMILGNYDSKPAERKKSVIDWKRVGIGIVMFIGNVIVWIMHQSR